MNRKTENGVWPLMNQVEMMPRTVPIGTAFRLLGLLGILTLTGYAHAAPQQLEAYNESWTTPSEDSRGSMPLGNGDIGLNVWVEKSGDLIFYISKTDSWSDNLTGAKGLPKVGKVRIKASPALSIDSAFVQTLKLATGEVEVHVGGSILRVWVDANRPIIHVDSESVLPNELQVAFETTRPVPEKNLQADVILTNQPDRVVWYYRNQNKQVRQLTHRTFGAEIYGANLISESVTALHSAKAAQKHSVAIAVLTAQTETPELWLQQLQDVVKSAEAVPLETARREHAQWWNEFWNRSWIFATGDEDATKVTRGYVLQRFVSACAGRGGAPIKFNGSIFTMDWHKSEKVKGVETNSIVVADARDWGGQYWFQNTRPMYWPMLQSGDFEMMQPLFKMFRAILPDNEKEVLEFYHHEGAYFAETKPFYGGINRLAVDAPGKYTDFYYTPILELSAMMLDYYAYTGDKSFVRETLLPMADAGMKFFDQHWKHENGKLVLDPDNAIEMFWKSRNPAPDIAGLRWVLPGLLALPTELTSEEQRSRWQRFLKEIPELPLGETNGLKVLAPAEVYDQGHNFENPELYAVYPFRLFGLGKPDLDLAKATFGVRRFKDDGCWRQSGVQAALLGETASARKNVVFVLKRKDAQCRFPAFWAHGSDHVPDEDNGGHGILALQWMLLQGEGRKIVLLPAWPKTWNASFKLHAPFNTTVEGIFHDGKIESLKVTPPERRADVILPNFTNYPCGMAKPASPPCYTNCIAVN